MNRLLCSYVVYDDANRQMDTFGPVRLAKWREMPAGWSIERFYGPISQGVVSLADVKQHAAEVLAELEQAYA